MTIATNVKTICKQQGINLTILAGRLNVTQSAIYQYLNNPSIQLSTIEKIANALNVNVTDIFNVNNQTFINTNQTNNNNIMLSCPHCHKIINIEIKQPK